MILMHDSAKAESLLVTKKKKQSWWSRKDRSSV